MSISELVSKNRKEVSADVLDSLHAAIAENTLNNRVVIKLRSKAKYHIDRVQKLLGSFEGEGMLYINSMYTTNLKICPYSHFACHQCPGLLFYTNPDLV